MTELVPAYQDEAVLPKHVAICFDGDASMYGGVQDHINTLIGYMLDRGIDPHVLVGGIGNAALVGNVFTSLGRHQKLEDNLHCLGRIVTINANGSQNAIPTRPSKGLLYDNLGKNPKPDIVHTMLPGWAHVSGRLERYAQKRGIRTVGTYHIDSDQWLTNLSVKMGGAIDHGPLKRLDAMIAVSGVAEKHLRKYYGYSGDVKQIPNGVNIDWYRRSKPFEADEPYEGYDPIERKTIVFVGRPDERKGLKELIMATSTLRKTMPDIQLIICGGDETSLQPYKALVKDEDLDDVTHFAGGVPNEVKARWFASADIATLLALYGESQGIVLIEAIAAGAVTIGGDNPGYREVLEKTDESDLTLVDPRSRYELASRMGAVLASDALAKRIRAAQQPILPHYDIAATGQQTLDVYQSVLTA